MPLPHGPTYHGGLFAPSLCMWSKSHKAQLSTPRQTHNLNSEPTGHGPVVEREILKSGCTEICATPEQTLHQTGHRTHPGHLWRTYVAVSAPFCELFWIKLSVTVQCRFIYS